jgi:histidinol-phosphate/aromatic aminotransferase/cobyric acid decarboxylase-like protein
VRFPLADWIDRHDGVPHNLGRSGLKGVHPALERTLRHLETPDPDALTATLARLVGVAPRRLFLTHGASEGNALVLVFLARYLGGPKLPHPRYAVPVPEYPPLSEAADWAGLRRARPTDSAQIVACSDPNNPTGRPLAENRSFARRLRSARAILVDETFREFTETRSRAAPGDPRTWVTGTFTKVYGADRIRVGFVVAPPGAASTFSRFHGIMTDEIAPASVAAARSILRDRETLLADSRARLERNAAALRSALPGVPPPRGPIHFDRGPDGLDGDRFARFALRSGVLVCPGSYFGDPTGVRLCLTGPSFPKDLEAYLRVRTAWLQRSRITASGSTPRPASRRRRGARSAGGSSGRSGRAQGVPRAPEGTR